MDAKVIEFTVSYIITHLPESDIKYKIKKAATLPVSYDIRTIVSVLGNGTGLTAQDTVPFALWCAAHHLDNFEEAIWTAVSGLGDRDTIAAIVGSIVVLYAPENTVPEEWTQRVEKFDTSMFYK
ncbi:ADP-ribosylglycohydrolase family protein [Chitinophaga sp. HK235]|uniref:ADP-ribosylglycohydrolase family protein n=1 Tax=Chitinophaga sp. HK235 TaxID=2952571 RepID=UPI001BA67151|nr:ADP-ribosylglycohydrolase family protein [Chitinophaga sp. HK235]